MKADTRTHIAREVSILVIGAGPAGLAAATAAARNGAKVVVLDDNPAPGGQIWRGNIPPGDSLRGLTIRNFRASGARLLSGRFVVDAPHPHTVRSFCESTGEIEDFTWDRLILATGARERFLPFPGWTLPGVFACLGAVSNSIAMLTVMRMLSGGAAASVQAVGAGTIADLWQVKERGRAIDSFLRELYHPGRDVAPDDLETGLGQHL